MKKILLMGACLWALGSAPALAQASGPEVVVVKVTENYGYLEFDIARPGSKPEHRAFKVRQLAELAPNGRAVSGQAEATRLLLAELAQQGYSLTTSYGHSPVTLVFTKR